MKKELKEAKKVALHTLGCRLNFSETGTIAKGFVDRGYAVVPFGEEADVVVVNTCTVTDGADSSCRNLIRKAHRSSPEGKIVVVGCYSQMEPEAVASIQGVDLIMGSAEKYKLFDYLNEEEQLTRVGMTTEFMRARSSEVDGHTRAFLKIQDGCNYICSFCIIPQARGRSRAIKLEDAVTEAKTLVKEGHKEIVLTGVNIGEYEKASGTPLYRLVEEIQKVDGLERFRLSSVEPNTLTDKLLEVLRGSSKFMNHFHIPLQSGDDHILKSMRRKYTVEEYKSLITKIQKIFPDAAFGADIILGYPGESDESFQKTYELLKELPITHFHPFPYSQRRGTTAAKMENHIQHGVKKDRVKSIIHLGDSKLRMFSEGLVGTKNNVLFERKNKEGLWEGYTTNFVRVYIESEAELKNKILEVYLSEMSLNGLRGTLTS